MHPSFQVLHTSKNSLMKLSRKDPDGEIENSGKTIFEIRISIFCYIQVIVFDLGYLPVAAVGNCWEGQKL